METVMINCKYYFLNKIISKQNYEKKTFHFSTAKIVSLVCNVGIFEYFLSDGMWPPSIRMAYLPKS